MEISMAVKETLAQFRGAFPDEGRCEVYLFRRRWPNGFVCPNCGFGRYAALTTRGHTYECLRCHKQTSITAGTVKHRSKLPLTVWFGAIHLVTARSNDISARRAPDVVAHREKQRPASKAEAGSIDISGAPVV